MEIIVTLEGGKRVDAHFDGFTVQTDQSREHGGDASAPEPFALFLASLGTCAGLYVLGFCQARGIPTEGIRLLQHSTNDAKGKLLRVVLEVQVPPEFPEQYREPVARAAAACKVKKTLADPPELIAITQVVGGEPAQIAH